MTRKRRQIWQFQNCFEFGVTTVTRLCTGGKIEKKAHQTEVNLLHAKL